MNTKWDYKKAKSSENAEEKTENKNNNNDSENNKHTNPYANIYTMSGKQALKALASKNKSHDEGDKDKGGRPKSIKADKVISMHISKIGMKLIRIREKTLQDEIEELANDALFELSILKECLKEMKIL